MICIHFLVLIHKEQNFNNKNIPLLDCLGFCVQDIKRFNKSDFYKRIDDEGNEEVKDIELKDYGITDTMTSYIIEFVKGLLLETIAPEMANMHRVYAEQYFDDLEEQQTLFNQNKVNNVLKMY